MFFFALIVFNVIGLTKSGYFFATTQKNRTTLVGVVLLLVKTQKTTTPRKLSFGMEDDINIF